MKINILPTVRKWWQETTTHIDGVYVALYGLFFCLLSLGQLQRTTQVLPVSGYIHEFVMLAIVGWWAWRNVDIHHLAPPRPPKVILITIAWFLLTSIIGQSQQFEILQLLSGLRFIFYSIFLFVTWKISSAHKSKVFSLFPVISLLYMWLLGILQYIFIPDTRFLRLLNWDDHYYRMIGTIFDPNFLGILLVILIGFCWFVYQQSANKWQPYILAIILLLSFTQAFTISRASYLAFLGFLAWICLHVYLTNKNRQKQFFTWSFSLIMVLFGVLGYFIAPKPGGEGVNITRTSTIEARQVYLNTQVINLDTQTVLIGQGLFWRQESSPDSLSRGLLPDNLGMLFIQGGGVIGLVLAVSVLYLIFRYLQHRSVIFAALLLAVLIHSQFNNTLLQPFVFLYLGTGYIFLLQLPKKITLIK